MDTEISKCRFQVMAGYSR
jgi:hypothetical protein